MPKRKPPVVFRPADAHPNPAVSPPEPGVPGTTTEDVWQNLRGLTAARIALGRAGTSQPTAPHLEFQLAHGRARDAVHARLDTVALAEQLRGRGHETLLLASAAPDRATYLQRPDLGRTLSQSALELLERRRKDRGDPAKPNAKSGAASGAKPRFDVAFVIADGLSALAIERNALSLIDAVWPLLEGSRWRLAPIAVVSQGRVAIGDEIAWRLGAGLVVVLIGERPGLSAPDSLGVYLTHAPKPGRRDAERNCISNIREGGQSHAAAAATLVYLIGEARRRKLSGVQLKDDTAKPTLGTTAQQNSLDARRDKLTADKDRQP